jgi:hypothetical protein
MAYLLSTPPPRWNILQLLLVEDDLGPVTNLPHPPSAQEYSSAGAWKGGLGLVTYLLSTPPPRGNILQLLLVEDELGPVTNLTHPPPHRNILQLLLGKGGWGPVTYFLSASPPRGIFFSLRKVAWVS